MIKYINNKKLLLIILFVLSLSCEDEKNEKTGFGKIDAKIIFEYNHTAQDPILVESPISEKNDQKIITDEFSYYVKSKIKPDAEAYDDEGREQKIITSPIKLEKSKLASSIKYVIISVAELQPVEVSVSGTSASTTINNIPIGPQSVKVDLTTADKTVLYTETKTVNIADGVTATPTFNKFTAKNETLRLTKPNGGETFEPGKRMTIQWERSHESIPVKLELFSNNQKLRTIISSVSNSGLYNYDIPSSLNARNDYQVKIVSTQNPDVFDLSDSFFEFIDVLPPATPTGLTATAGNQQVALTWNANSESDLKEYKVFGNTGTTPSTQLAVIAKGTEAYTHTNLNNGLTYSYSISAVDNNGNESNRASTVLATPDDGPPATPTGLAATAGNGQVVLTWNANSEDDLSYYKVWGGTDSSLPNKIADVQAGTETYTHTGLTNGVTYYYGVTAVDNSNNESTKTIPGLSAKPESSPSASYGLSFNGNNKVTLKEIDNTTSEVSISAWVYPTEINIENIVASDGLLLALHETKGICFEVKIGGSVTGVCAPKDKSDLLNKWNHIVGVYNGGNSQALTIYLNDDNQKMALGDGFLQLSSNNAMNFGIGTNGGDGFNGYLDEVALWDIALSRSEVTAIHNSGTALDPRSNSGNYTSSNDLKSYWKMEDGSGTTLTDLSGYGNDGTIDGASWINGVSSASYDNTPINRGNALSFDGADDIVSGTASSSLDVSSSNKLTIAAWIKPYRKQSKQQRIFTHGNDAAKAQYALLLSMHKIYFLAGNGAFESGGNNFSNNTINYQKWNFVTMTYDGNAVKIYINSALDLTHTVADNFTQDFMGKFFIGARSDGSERFDGNIDEVGIWNNALTANEITDLYNSGKALDARSNSGNYASTSNLVGYWKMEDGSGTTLTDVSGYGNDGAIDGASWTQGVISTSYNNTPKTIEGEEGGNALSLNGTDNYVSFNQSDNHDFNNNSEATLSAWVKIDAFDPNDSNSGTQRIIAKKDGYYLAIEYFDGAPKFEARFKVNSTDAGWKDVRSTTTPLINKWYHVVSTYKREDNKEDNKIKLYVNGIAETINSSIQSNNFITTSNEPLHFGALSMGGGTYNSHLDGNIDEVGIWNNALTANEITDLYNFGKALDARSNWGNYTSTSNLVGYWKMEDGSGTTLTDVSSYGNDGTINGASWTTGILSTSYDNTPASYGNSLSFDGNNDLVSIQPSASILIDGAISLSAWVKIPVSHNSNWGTIFGGYDEYHFNLYAGSNNSSSNGVVQLENRNGTVATGSTDLRDNKWHHVMAVYDGSNKYIYVDGSLEATQSSSRSTPSTSTSKKLIIGHVNHSTGSNEFFPGKIDEAAIWSGALSQSEVTAIYNSGTALDLRSNSGDYQSKSNLKAYWKMEDGSGTTLTDVSGYGNNGSIDGASWSSGNQSTSYDNTPLTIDNEAPAKPADLKATSKSGSGGYGDNSGSLEIEIWENN